VSQAFPESCAGLPFLPLHRSITALIPRVNNYEQMGFSPIFSQPNAHCINFWSGNLFRVLLKFIGNPLKLKE